jgi:hypothetical protein
MTTTSLDEGESPLIRSLLFPFCSLVDSYTALTSLAPMEALANPAMPRRHQSIDIHAHSTVR